MDPVTAAFYAFIGGLTFAVTMAVLIARDKRW
jgi:hypothetical protein